MPGRGAGRGGHTIAGAALRGAGLVVDGDVGMRDAAGPSRSRGGASGGRKGQRNGGADPSSSVSDPIFMSQRDRMRHELRQSTVSS